MNWLERYFFSPSLFQKCLAFALLPLSFLYAFIATLNSKFRSKIDFNIPIISVGNLSFGGNGKTPLCKAISREFKGVFIVLRGYKRKSKGLMLVKHQNNIFCEVAQSGDEAMEYAFCESIEGVIVSEDRIKGIKEALKLGAKVILLDDAFSKFHIKKFDILVEGKPLPYFNFTLPSGAYRLPLYFKKRADFIAREGEEFYRYSFVKENVKAILVTAIAKPYRLNEHFDKARACYFFNDHHHFTKEELENLLKKHHCHTLMLTLKDYVKVKDFGFKCEIIELNVELSQNFKEHLKAYVRSFNAIN